MISNNIPNSLAKGHRDIKPDIKRNWKFSHLKNDGKGRMRSLLLPYFSDCKNRRITKKRISQHLRWSFFVALVDSLFGKQLNNITKKPISDVEGVLDLPLYLVF